MEPGAADAPVAAAASGGALAGTFVDVDKARSCTYLRKRLLLLRMNSGNGFMKCVGDNCRIKGRGMWRRVRRAAVALMVSAAITGFAAASAGAEEAPPKLLVLGDSLTAGYGLAREQAFPAQLERALAKRGLKIKVINSGISGDTTKGGLDRLPWVLSAKPDYVIVELGSNDGLRGLDPKQTRSNLDAIITRLKARGIKVLLAGMLAPRNLGKQYEQEFNGAYKELAEKHDVVFMPFFLKDVALRPKLNQPDGIHPTAEGVAVIVRNIMPYVLELLGRQPS